MTMFDHLDSVLLARAQFAFTVSFHFIFPSFSIGLASYLMVLEGLWLKTGKGVYANLYRYWLKIFSVVFGMGVVSGIVMSYQLGTNWPVFSDKVGPVIGPLMAYEVLTAFFLEAGFLGVMQSPPDPRYCSDSTEKFVQRCQPAFRAARSASASSAPPAAMSCAATMISAALDPA